jgi:EpsI family protein
VTATAETQAPPTSAWPSMTALALWLVVAAAFAQVHAEAIRGLLRLWDGSPMYSYGYLVPFVSLFLVWSRREALVRHRPQPSRAGGAALLALWLALLIAGRFSAIVLAEQLALVVAVAAGVVLVWGWGTLRIVWAAVAYLLLMVPLWDGFTEPLHPRFQSLSATIGVWVLELFGIPAHRDGVFITLPTMTLEVARACSGVNYLVAVLALGLPLGYLYLRSPWRRVVLIVSALVIAALSNSLRVAMIGVLVHLDIGAPLHGPGHMLHGLFVSGIGYVALFAGLAILRRGEAVEADVTGAAHIAPGSARWRQIGPAVALAAVFLATTAFAAWRQPAPVALAATLDRLPVTLGGWTADPYTAPAALAWWPGADQELRRVYRHDQRAVDVHVSYFGWQRQSREVVTYRASDLHRAAHVVDASLDAGRQSRVNVAGEHLAGLPTLTLFWYEIDGAVETAPLAVKMRTLWHALARGRTNGAVVCLRTADPGPAGRDAAIADLVALAAGVHRGLSSTLPGRPLGLSAGLAGVPAGGAR